jgi:uncharacterized membrane protein YphA (DoxX/SURF4 family)
MAVLDNSIAGAADAPDSLVAETRNEEEAATRAWSPFRRVAFRFAFSYLALYLFSRYLNLVDDLPHGDVVTGWYEKLWAAFVPWIGKHLFHVDAPSRVTGSGDSMFSWLQVLCMLAISLVAALVWTLLDRRRTQYARLYNGLRVAMQVGLGLILIEYGALKVVPSQFGQPSLSRLLQPFGDASPMGLLWTFMGASVPYTIFAGLSELVAGLLLLFRRTATLGALVAIPVLTNVVVLNFCYDVPVKLFSLHLLAMAVFLAVPDLGRLANLLVLHRPVAPAADRPFFRRRRWQIAAVVLEGALAVGFTAFILHMGYDDLKDYYDSMRSPLYGVWTVEELKIDGRARDEQAAEDLQWRRLVFDYPTVLSIQLSSDSRRRYWLKLDAAHKTLELTKRGDPNWKSTLAYGRPAADRLTLEGTFGGHRLQASLRRGDSSKFILMNRGFHWVSEYPFNR